MSEPLDRVSSICLGLPEATREDAGRHAGFRVRGRTFTWFQDDHHGDETVCIVCKAGPGENTRLVADDPVRYTMPSYNGPKGWVGFRLDTAAVDWDEAERLIVESYRLVAPKGLAAQL